MKKTSNRSVTRAKRVLLASLVLFVLCLAIAHQPHSYDQVILRWIYGLPPAVALPSYVITQLGSPIAIAIAALVALLLNRKKVAIALLGSGALAYTLIAWVKVTVARPRPDTLLPDVIVRFEQTLGHSFPSGHTAIATALALSVWPYIPPRYRWLLVVWIVVVGLSRINLGVHWPVDIVGGFAVGAFAAAVVRLIMLYFAQKQR